MCVTIKQANGKLSVSRNYTYISKRPKRHFAIIVIITIMSCEKPQYPAAAFDICFVPFEGKAVINIRGETRRLIYDFFYNDNLFSATIMNPTELCISGQLNATVLTPLKGVLFIFFLEGGNYFIFLCTSFPQRQCYE